MRKILLLIELLTVLTLNLQIVVAQGTTSNITILVNPTNKVPKIWSSSVEIQDVFHSILTRPSNYGFTGERLNWTVMVRDENGVVDIKKVLLIVENVNNSTDLVDFNYSCSLVSPQPTTGDYIDFAGQTFNSTTDKLYECIVYIQPLWQGNKTIKHIVIDSANNINYTQEYFFFNPSVSLDIEPTTLLVFNNIGPGQTGYSDNITITNNGEGGVQVQLHIYGTDFYDSRHNNTICPLTNKLSLTNFAYYAEYSYNSSINTTLNSDSDTQGYSPITYVRRELINTTQLLSPGEYAIVNIRLSLPNPCNGVFDEGNIFFYAETR